jgi:hypothetical protein
MPAPQLSLPGDKTHLYLIIIGSLILSLSILAQSIDEGVYWYSATAFLDETCMAALWVFFVGYAVVSSTFVVVLLPAVTTRPRRLVIPALKFQHEIRGSFVAVAALIILTAILLTTWSIVDPIRWTRRDINDIPLETFGTCDSRDMRIHFGLLVTLFCLVHLLSLLAVHCRRRRPTSRTTGTMIFTDTDTCSQATCLNLQAWSFGIPMYILVDTSSADGNYLVRVGLVWVIAMTGLAVVVTPHAYQSVQLRFFPQSAIPSARYRTLSAMMATEVVDYFQLHRIRHRPAVLPSEDAVVSNPFSSRR